MSPSVRRTRQQFLRPRRAPAAHSPVARDPRHQNLAALNLHFNLHQYRVVLNLRHQSRVALNPHHQSLAVHGLQTFTQPVNPHRLRQPQPIPPLFPHPRIPRLSPQQASLRLHQLHLRQVFRRKLFRLDYNLT